MAVNPSTTNLVFEAIRAELQPGTAAAVICLTRAQARAVLSERDDLLEALKDIRDLQMGRGDGVVGDYIEDIQEIVAAAIAKAEGR